jgi:hypothetical protein
VKLSRLSRPLYGPENINNLSHFLSKTAKKQLKFLKILNSWREKYLNFPPRNYNNAKITIAKNQRKLSQNEKGYSQCSLLLPTVLYLTQK